ncbi:IPT/TIG domain-containing protein [Acidisphaera rubrifaciens]|uniref:Uncharacterized protein n=1 Tax=Acidisphaera rubrifaciens HS-AP3 TaxID=1231350 RepID=A0A0D6P3Y0_9PROT|nr:IPT/TIG domain-containing protein [Acidisphaera rubrifaciens]GAN75898.1 hypothetical protein Asru_0019_04 [Acidisphaera rubrifaciens HS-AP3]
MTSQTTSLPTIEQVLRIDFTIGGNGAAHTGEGWSVPEPQHTWMLGAASDLGVPLPEGAGDGAYFIQMRVTPFTAGDGGAGAQRLRVLINGHEAARHVLERQETLTVFVPPEAAEADGPLRITIEHPDARRASDVLPVDDARELSIGVHMLRVLRVIERDVPLLLDGAPAAPPAEALLVDIATLGEGPALTRFRATHGVELLDVLNGGTWTLAGLVEALVDDFAAIGRIDGIAAMPCAHADGRETWFAGVRAYGLAYDTGRATAEIDEATMRRREHARLTIAVRRLRQTLAAGSRLLLLHQDVPASDEAMIPLLAALLDRGTSTLLWVTPADAAHPPGTVELLMRGLLRGYVAEPAAAPGDMAAADDGGWMQVCRRGWRLRRALCPSAPAATDPVTDTPPSDRRAA